VGREDVTDHRRAPGLKTSAWVPGANVHYDFPRLDIGRLEYHPAGHILSGTMRQVLWDAEVAVDLVTTRGRVHLRAFTDAVRMVQVVEVTSNETQAGSAAAATGRWEFRPGVPDAPRRMVLPQEAGAQTYPLNPNPALSEIGPIHLCTQPLLAGGDYATAWSEPEWTTSHGAQHSTLLLTTANDVPAAGASGPQAVATLRAAATAGDAALTAEHRAWWHALYPASFVALPDPQMEAFYWIQIYKLASASRSGGDLIDDDGPWMRVNRWPYATWNLNVQLTYWPAYASNHLDLGRSLTEYVDRHFDAMALAYEGKPGLGNLAWTLHDYWWQARFEGDRALLDQGWYPKAVHVAAAYHRMLVPGPEGRLHLPPMESPEYPGQAKTGFSNFRDSSYNLALCRWLFQTLLDTASAEHRDPDLQAVWAADLSALTPLPTGPDGIQIGADQPVALSHRHFSHLLAIYPLYELDAGNPADHALMDQSIAHWQSIEGGAGLAGFSFTGGAKLYAAMHQGDRAYSMLETFLQETKGVGRLYPNTFYCESGGRNPVIETPLSAASAMLDLLLQSTPRAIEVFPALPSTWQDVSFSSLRAAGGFLISAARSHGATGWVQVTSLKGEPLTLQVEGWQGDLHVLGPHPRVLHPDHGVYHLTPVSGETLLLSPDPAFRAASARVTVPPAAPAAQNPYGLKTGMSLDFGQVWPEIVQAPTSTTPGLETRRSP
jgi:hypothetical protein